MFENYKAKYERRRKFIFEPNDEANRRGEIILRFVERSVDFPDNFYHYKRGGHVAAIHRHLAHAYFFKMDVERFFYSISRSRVSETLHHFGFHDARDFAAWSCVKNPYGEPTYALPIGFVQSPALASLTLMRSPLMAAITEAERRHGVFTSVYLDDFICSGDHLATLRLAYQEFLDAVGMANFRAHKLCEPSPQIVAFNCDIRPGYATVTTERIDRFREEARGAQSIDAFDAYCRKVSELNR
jgi:Reverse transcriptase (RNA-dependent DNA polymerase)